MFSFSGLFGAKLEEDVPCGLFTVTSSLYIPHQALLVGCSLSFRLQGNDIN